MKKGTKVIVTVWKKDYRKPVTVLSNKKEYVGSRRVVLVSSSFGRMHVYADECKIVK